MEIPKIIKEVDKKEKAKTEIVESYGILQPTLSEVPKEWGRTWKSSYRSFHKLLQGSESKESNIKFRRWIIWWFCHAYASGTHTEASISQ